MTCWTNWVIRKMEPKVPKYMKNDTAFVTANARLANRSSGTIGASVRRSWATNTASRTAPADRLPTISGLVHPSPWPRTRPKTSANRPVVTRPTPGRSRRVASPRLSRRKTAASGSRTTPSGTLIQKIHCHERPETTAPPTSGPSAMPRPLMPDQMPSAAPRRSGGNASASRVRVSGATIAPPMPCRARAATSSEAPGARAAAAEEAVKRASPARKVRLRPKRSPSAAPGIRVTAKASV